MTGQVEQHVVSPAIPNAQQKDTAGVFAFDDFRRTIVASHVVLVDPQLLVEDCLGRGLWRPIGLVVPEVRHVSSMVDAHRGDPSISSVKKVKHRLLFSRRA